jgi:predicted amidohydrolase YtcJ
MHLRGDVITLDPSRPRAGGVVVRDGVVVALDGSGGEAIPDGAVILPGFTDAHVHLLSWSSSLRELALSGLSRETILQLVADDRSDFVRGYGWSAEDWPEQPARQALDAVCSDRPVALLAHDWHTLWVNSAALALAREPLEVPGGVVERDAAGAPTGILREESAWAFRDRYALPTRAETLAALEAALPELSRRG